MSIATRIAVWKQLLAAAANVFGQKMAAEAAVELNAPHASIGDLTPEDFLPAIFNTAQGSQFASADFSTLPRKHVIAISLDGKGCWRHNVYNGNGGLL